jgi:hypothetical protein
MSLAQLQEANGISMKSLGKPGQPLLVLKDSATESTPAASSLTELNENTPVNVAETADKPTGKNSAALTQSAANKTATPVSSKDDKAAKTAKTDKTDKSTKAAKSDKTTAKSSSTAKSPAKSTSDPKPAAAKSSSKSTAKSGNNKSK